MSEDGPIQVERNRREFVLRRVMSLCGVVPLGVFVVAHLVAMTQALRGPEAFSDALASLTPTRMTIEAVLIGLPLLVHAAIGLALTTRTRANVSSYPYSGNLAWLLQRITGVIVLLFVIGHLWQTRVKLVIGQSATADLHGELVASLSSTGAFGFPLHAAAYLLGIAATVYHLGNGVVGFCASFGLVQSLRSLGRLRLVCALFGAVLFALGATTLIHLATGTASPWGTT